MTIYTSTYLHAPGPKFSEHAPIPGLHATLIRVCYLILQAIPKLSSTFTLSTSNGLSQNSINSINTIYEDKVVEDSSSSVSTPTTETTSLPHSRQRRKSVEERSSTSENEASIQLEMVGKRIGGMGAAQQPKVRHFYAMWKGDKALMIDVVSRIVFPFTFLVFNIIYWMYYIFNTAP